MPDAPELEHRESRIPRNQGLLITLQATERLSAANQRHVVIAHSPKDLVELEERTIEQPQRKQRLAHGIEELLIYRPERSSCDERVQRSLVLPAVREEKATITLRFEVLRIEADRMIERRYRLVEITFVLG